MFALISPYYPANLFMLGKTIFHPFGFFDNNFFKRLYQIKYDYSSTFVRTPIAFNQRAERYWLKFKINLCYLYDIHEYHHQHQQQQQSSAIHGMLTILCRLSPTKTFKHTSIHTSYHTFHIWLSNIWIGNHKID